MINKLFAPKELANLHKALQEFDVDQFFDRSNPGQNALKEAFYNDLASSSVLKEPISAYDADIFFYLMQKQAERKNIEFSLESPLWEDKEELAKTFRSFRDLFINNVVAYEEDGETPLSQNAQDSKLNIDAQRTAYENVYGNKVLDAPAPAAPTLDPVAEPTAAKLDEEDLEERINKALEGDFDPEALAALAAEKKEQAAISDNETETPAAKKDADKDPRAPRAFNMDDLVMDEVSGSYVDKKFAPYLEDAQFSAFRTLINNTVVDQEGNSPSLDELAEVYDFKKAQKTAGTAYDNGIDLLLDRNEKLTDEKEKHTNALMWYVQAEFEKELDKNYVPDQDNRDAVFTLGNAVFGSPEGNNLYPEVMRYQALTDDGDKPDRITRLVSEFDALDKKAKEEEKEVDLEAFRKKLQKENDALSYGIFEKYAKRACDQGRYADQLFGKSEEETPDTLKDLYKGFTEQADPQTGQVIRNDNIVLGMRAMEQDKGPEAIDSYTRAIIHRTLDAKAFEELTAEDYNGDNKDLFDKPELRQAFFNNIVNERAEKRGIAPDDFDAAEKLSGKTIDQISRLDDNRRKAYVSAKFDKTYEESQSQEPQKGQKITPMARIRGVGSFLKTNWVGLVGAAGAGLGARWVLQNMLNPDQLAAGLSLAGETGMLGLTVATGGALGMVSGAVGNLVFQSWQGYTIARDAATAGHPELKGQYWKLCLTDQETRKDVYRSIRENFSFKSFALGTVLGGTVGSAFAYLANTELLGNLFDSLKGVLPGFGADAPAGDVVAVDTPAAPVEGEVTGGVPADADVAAPTAPPAQDPATLPGCDIAAPLPEGIDDTVKTQIIESIRADGNVSSYEAGIIDRLENGDLGVQLQAAKDFTATIPDTPLQKEVLTMLDTGYGDLIHHPQAQENSTLMRALTQINSDLGFESLRDLVQSGIQDGDPKLLEAIQNVIQAAEQGHSQSIIHLDFAQSQFPDSYAAALELNQSEAQKLSACFAGNSVAQPEAAVPGADSPAPDTADAAAEAAQEDGPLHCDKDNPQGVAPAAEQPEAAVVEQQPQEPSEVSEPLACTKEDPYGDGYAESRIREAFEAVKNATPAPVATILEGGDPNYEQVIFEANAAAATDQLLQNTAYADNGALIEEGGKIYYATGTGADMVVKHVGDTENGLFLTFAIENPNIAQAVNYEQVVATQAAAPEAVEQKVHPRAASRKGMS